MKKIGNIITMLALMLTWVGCDNGYDCDLNNISYNNITFYTLADGQEAPYANPTPLTVSLMVNGKDSVIVNHITDATVISLPMSYAQNTDTVVFHYEDNSTDSLYVDHTTKPFYQSMECGILIHHQIEQVKCTNVWIEGAAIVNNAVNFNGNENIRIYFYQ
ncbi:MAG: hypothetical protein IJZ22_05650 [Bacteroidaceae bacterium]|nr:hypothetical protein [Bacteroidaceae bacterium]